MESEPKFDEMAKVRVNYETEPMEGFVVDRQFKEGRWIYKISHPEPENPADSFDNWMSEENLELV